MSLELIDKAMTDVFNPKEQMVMELEQFNEMNSQVGAAPLGINVLGLLCLTTAERDFDLRCDEWNNFKLIQFPGSFRACLCQAVHSGCKSFQKADSTMEAIRCHTGRVPNLLKTVLKLLYHPQATRKDLETYVPTNLNEIKKVADECIIEAESVKEEFSNVIELLSELQTATLYKQGKVEDAKRLTEDRIKWEERTKADIEKQKEDMNSEIKELKKECEEWKGEFQKSLISMPNVFELALGSLADSVNNAFSFFSNKQMVSRKSHKVEETESENEDQKKHTEKFITIDGKDVSVNPDLLSSYLFDIPELEKTYEQILSLFQTDGNSETVLCKTNAKNVIDSVKEDLDYRMTRLDNKKEKKLTEKLTGTIKTTLKLTKELERNQKNAEKLKHLKNEIEKHSKEITNLALCIKMICKVPQFPKRGPKMSEGSESVVVNLQERAYMRVEITKIALEEAKKREAETNKRRMQTMKEMNECIMQINNLEFEKEQQESILAVISKGIDAFQEFQNQWSQLILFFSNIAIFIKCSMSEEMNKFVKDANNTNQNDNITSELGREIVYQAAYQAVKTASYVHYLSEAYCSISRKHLMPLNNKLHNLLSLSSKSREEVEQHRIQLEKDCLAVVEEIKSIINSKHKEYEEKSNSRVKSLYQGLQAIVPISQEEQNEIASNTLKIYKDTVQNFVISDDSFDSHC